MCGFECSMLGSCSGWGFGLNGSHRYQVDPVTTNPHDLPALIPLCPSRELIYWPLLSFLTRHTLVSCAFSCLTLASDSWKMQLEHPSMDIHKEGKYLMLAIQELLSGDQCEGRFVFGRYSKKPTESHHKERYTGLLQTLMMGDGPLSPKYKTKHIKTKEYRALAEFKANAVSRETEEKQALSEKDGDVLAWLTRTSENSHVKDFNSPLDVTDIKAHSTLRK